MPQRISKPSELTSLTGLMSPSALKLLTSSGSDFIKQIGIDVVRGVVLDVLSGRNLRDSTEALTRRRIAALNLATLDLFLKGSSISTDFINQLPHVAADILTRKRLAKTERWVAQWVLGLNSKSFENVLRDRTDSLGEYGDRYMETCREVIANHTQEYGQLSGILEMDSGVRAKVNWLFMTYLLNTVGAQTLAIRGSEKSTYGKLFEKLVLGSLLSILGFRYEPAGHPTDPNRVFWLSSRGERRESDATLLYELGKGVRFDIGFIGRGNPEISLDKVSRFERETLLGKTLSYIETIIIVDRIGANSRIERLAKELGATIVQMSAGYWPQQVARELNRVFGFKHDLVNIEQTKIEELLKRKLTQVSLEAFLETKEGKAFHRISESQESYSE